MTTPTVDLYEWRDNIFKPNLSDENYSACLRFCEELYTLQSPLYRLIKKALRNFKQHLLNEEKIIGIQPENEYLVNCIMANQATSVLHCKTTKVSSWRKPNGWRILSNYCARFFPTNTHDLVDPSTLLTLIRGCGLFPKHIRISATNILRERHACYEHVPELRFGASVRSRVESVRWDIKILKSFISSKTSRKCLSYMHHTQQLIYD